MGLTLGLGLDSEIGPIDKIEANMDKNENDKQYLKHEQILNTIYFDENAIRIRTNTIS